MLEKGRIVLRNDQNDGELWKVVGTYSDVKTPLDYELVYVNNPDIWDMFTSYEVSDKLQSGTWKKVNL